MTKLRTTFALLAGVLSLIASESSCVHAQSAEPRKSQHATVSQNIASTVITLTYNRPVARGRTLFGGIVEWGKVWTPGADSATFITLSTPIKINGSSLDAGTYSMWAQPTADKWTIIFSSAQHVFHIPYPQGKDVLRIEATPRSGPHMETLAFYFPVVDGRHAELVVHWGTVVVPMSIEVP